MAKSKYGIQPYVLQQRKYWAKVGARVKATQGLSFIGQGITLNTRGVIPKVGIAGNCPQVINYGAIARVKATYAAARVPFNTPATSAEYNSLPYIYYPTYRGLVKALAMVFKYYPTLYVMAAPVNHKVICIGCNLDGNLIYCVCTSWYNAVPISKARVTKTVKHNYGTGSCRVRNFGYGVTAKQAAAIVAQNVLGLS